MTFRRRFGLLALTCLASTACSTYSVRRAALVPLAEPVTWDGQSMATRAEIHGSVSTTTITPDDADNADGLEIPAFQVDAGLRLRVGDNALIGFTWYEGLAEGSHAVADDQPPVDGGNVRGLGTTVAASIAIDEANGLRLGLLGELTILSVPYVEFRNCIDLCGDQPFTDITRDSETIATYTLAAIPSWRHGPITVFGGVTMREHPTIPRGGIEFGNDESGDVSDGEFVFVVSAGGEIEISGGARLGALVYQNLSTDPVDYGPGATVMLSIPIGSKASPAPQAPPGPPLRP